MSYYADDTVTLHHGDCLKVMAEFSDALVDSVVTDPPYGLEFMGKGWDAPWRESDVNADAGFNGGGISATRNLPTFTGSTNPKCAECKGTRRGRRDGTAKVAVCLCPDGGKFPNVRAVEMHAFQEWCEEWVSECLRVLKPGGHLLAFGGTRTCHRLAVAVEDAGFEIRDSIAWLYGSGFPKSKGHLKPAFEPIVVARKPLAGTVAANILTHGTGALNIDGCRVAATPEDVEIQRRRTGGVMGGLTGNTIYGPGTRNPAGNPAGRWPTNVVLSADQAAELDRQTGVLKSGAWTGQRNRPKFGDVFGAFGGEVKSETPRDASEGGASRFFPTFRYEAKAPTAERPTIDGAAHPTVKPLNLMRWLVRLVTPPGGTVLEPFAGSGTTAEACVHEHMRCIAIEREAAYLPLIVARLSKPMQVGFDFGGVA